MNICFVLPGFSFRPSGGYKMVYEYANRLNDRGHNITILFTNNKGFERLHAPKLLRNIFINSMTRGGPRWFDLNRSIETISLLDKRVEKSINCFDIVVFTAVDTVYETEPLFKYCNKKVYFIQGYENWEKSDKSVIATYSKGFVNIVVSSWLKNIVDQYATKPSILIRNPIDVDIYKPIVPVLNRKKHTISMLYHEGEKKGFKYAFAAVKKIKVKYPDLKVFVFGVFKRPDEFPDYFNYTRSASIQETVEIYNKTSIFLCGTVEEGYGLTGLEAMSCGTALVSTDYTGVHEYAIDGYNALLSPVKDVDSLAANISRLFEDNDLRISIANNGIKTVQKNFGWDEAVDKFENALN